MQHDQPRALSPSVARASPERYEVPRVRVGKDYTVAPRSAADGVTPCRRMTIVMARVDRTVFVCYRRTNVPWALAIYQNLTSHGYDVFFDFEGIASGDFETVILENIGSRAHFLVLLTPSALERINDPGDWMRREIEAALETQRNIVPLMLEGFDFNTPSIHRYLTGRLSDLDRYNALDVPVAYFPEAMERLRTRFLDVPLDAVVHPVHSSTREATSRQQAAAAAAPAVETGKLTAQGCFERAYNSTDLEDKMYYYDEAIRLQPDFPAAYINRGATRGRQGDLDGAIRDYDEALRLQPDDADAYYNRGGAQREKGDLDAAIQDYDAAIRLRPEHVSAHINRGIARGTRGDLDGAISDYDAAIRLEPDAPNAFYNRGAVRRRQGDLDGALRDYDEAIRLRPDYIDAYYNRALIRRRRADPSGAAADFQQYLDLGGGLRDGDQATVEGWVAELKR